MDVHVGRLSRTLVFWSLLGLAACGIAPEQKTSEISAGAAGKGRTSDAVVGESTSGSVLVPCADEIGSAAALRRVTVCRVVSPATHPPCNIANSCAMIEDEIARSCALFDGEGAPMPECQPAPKSMAAAAAVVQRYYSAINAHDYGTAWQQWGENGPPHQTPETFRAGFARTHSAQVTIGTLQPGEGAAGSIYQTVPVTIDAILDDGTRQRFTGEYIVRRANDVDGASPAQLRWHIDSAHLVPTAVN